MLKRIQWAMLTDAMLTDLNIDNFRSHISALKFKNCRTTFSKFRMQLIDPELCIICEFLTSSVLSFFIKNKFCKKTMQVKVLNFLLYLDNTAYLMSDSLSDTEKHRKDNTMFNFRQNFFAQIFYNGLDRFVWITVY